MKLPESEAADRPGGEGPPAWALAGVPDLAPGPNPAWQRLSGGRINDVWQSGSRVVKVYRPDGASPLFPNDPMAEARALRHLAALQITPRLRHLCAEPSRAALVIDAANHGQPESGAMGEVLARLHALPPVSQVRLVRTEPDDIRAEVAAYGLDPDLLPPEPSLPEGQPMRKFALLHGDPVPANFVSDRRGAKLIDWSASGLGDPAHDIALAVSPAMSSLYGRGDHTAHASALLGAYGNADSYARLAAWLHWRIAAYCLWRAARGAPGYHEAALLEITFLADLQS